MRSAFIVGFVLALAMGGAHAQDQSSAPERPAISDSEEKALILKVKTAWHSQDGETADQIIAKVAKVAHFIPRGWAVGQTDSGSKSVVVSWARHQTDREEDEYTILWDVNADGTVTLASPYAKPMELGWQAFALSLIQTEANDDERGFNKSFLHGVSNMNFVQTAQGKLGDLLAKGKCSLGDPIGVDYLDTWGRDHPAKGDFWRLQLSVNCNVPGPRYFTHNGVILFLKRGAENWRPYSFFAYRIATYHVGSWFDRREAKEQQFFAAAIATTARAGMGSSDTDYLIKSAELTNDGSLIPW